jgi:peptidyl-prolyl cis-trans isomerase SurA
MKNPQTSKPSFRSALLTGLVAGLAAASLLTACTPNLPPLAPLSRRPTPAATSPTRPKAASSATPSTPAVPKGVLLDRVVAVVNGSPILLSEVRSEERLLLAEIRSRGFQTPPPHAFRRQVLLRLVRERIEIEEARRHGIEASPSEVSAILSTIAARNHVAFARFPAWLARQGISYPAYRRQIAHAITLHRLLEAAVGPSITVPPSEIRAYLRRHSLHGAKEYELAEIVLAANADRPSALAKTKNEAELLVTALRHGASFSALAVAHSIARNSLKGGLMGWVTLRDLPRPARPAVEALRPHEISNPVETASGYVIYKLLGLRRQKLPHLYANEWKLERIVMIPTPVRGPKTVVAVLNRLRQEILHGARWTALARAYSVDPEVAINGGRMGWVEDAQLSPPYRAVVKHLRVSQVSTPFATAHGFAIVRVLGQRRRNVTHQTLMQQAYVKIFTRKFDAASRAYENRLFNESIVHYLVSWAS